MFLAIDKAKEVFPMFGHPAMMIRSPLCHPDVIPSSFVKPLGTPVNPSIFGEFFSMDIRSFGFGYHSEVIPYLRDIFGEIFQETLHLVGGVTREGKALFGEVTFDGFLHQCRLRIALL